jgi:hypothetical protein
VKGPASQSDAIKPVDEAVDHYTASLASLSAQLNIKLLEQGKEISDQVQALAGSVQLGFSGIVQPIQMMLGTPKSFANIRRAKQPCAAAQREWDLAMARSLLLECGSAAASVGTSQRQRYTPLDPRHA